jgi:serine/threonine-protein kinase
MIGRTIGKYRIVGQLGRGGMGTVYKAVDETLDREVAIKVLNPELADSDILKRFRTEATTLARLNHPEIATLYELFRTDTDLLMVMEFVRGETLDKLSDRLGPLLPDRAAYLIDKVLGALEHAHRAGIVHRDMKPANVMVTDIGGVKIMDFGIARVRGAEHMTIDGYMMGTPAYMPPEQVLGQEVDGRADLYSVGVLFYRLLTGALPFKADTAIGMVQKQISDPPLPLSVHRDGLPEWCETIMRQALAKAPDARFQSAEEFRSAVGKATGMATVEHTRAFSAVDLEGTHTPQPVRRDPSSLPAFASPSTAATAPRHFSARHPLSSPDGATIVLRRQHFTFAASVFAVLTLGLALLLYVTLLRPSPGRVAAAPLPAVSTVPPSAVSAVVPAPAMPAAVDAGVFSALTPVSAPVSVPESTRPRPIDVTPTPARTPRPSATGSAAPVRMYQPMVLDAKAFLIDDGRTREVDAQVVLSDGRITVTPNDLGDALHDVTYDSVRSINYSRGRDPLWNSPDGPAPVAKAGGGAFGIFRGDRHWVTLETDDELVVVRLGNLTQARRAMAALQERTGKPAVIVVDKPERKDVR